MEHFFFGGGEGGGGCGYSKVWVLGFKGIGFRVLGLGFRGVEFGIGLGACWVNPTPQIRRETERLQGC